MAKRTKTVGILALVGGLVAAAVALGASPGAASVRTPAPVRPPEPVAAKPLPAAPPPATPSPPLPPPPPTDCRGAASSPTDTTKGNPAARRAAQRGLDFLAREAVAWQQQYACYGCHVQAVTVEAFSVGVSHQYAVKKAAFDTVLGGMLDLQGGAHGPMGLFHGNPEIGKTAKVLGAAAFARYDALVGARVKRELLREARLVLARQRKDGSVTLPWTSPPIINGTVQGTSEALVIFKRAYDRTADDQWLTAIQLAESYLKVSAERWRGKAPDLQSLDYAILGLYAAGVGTQEAVMVGLADELRIQQRDDGGWALARGQGSSSFATGQALYTLRLLGMTDRDPSIARGTKWLIARQDRATGGWSDEGYDKAEAMWAVLGLVSIDVLSISVSGLEDGQHVDDAPTLAIEARDNTGGGVVKVSVDVDDREVASACGATLAWSWPREALGRGRRVLDVRATNQRGEVSHRRFEVYTGDTFMTQVGSHFADGVTEVSLRDLARSSDAHEVALEVFAAGADGKADSSRRVWARTQHGAQGALRFAWNGRSDDGTAQPAGKYVARLSYKDGTGTVRQTEEVGFVHDTAANQSRDYGQIQGALHLSGGGAAANAEVDLVDDRGQVVGSTRSTAAGQYRFRNVDAGKKYEIRVNKDGFAAAPASVAPAKAGEVSADIQVDAK